MKASRPSLVSSEARTVPKARSVIFFRVSSSAQADAMTTSRLAHTASGAQAVIWTTDLSYDYVKINAEYRT